MESTNYLCEIVAQINGWAFLASVLLVFVLGAFWYSILFVKMWKEVNKIDDTDASKIEKGNFFVTMFLQLTATALVGFVFFVLTKLSCLLAILVAIAIIGWMKANLKFKFTDWKTFIKASITEAGYFAIAAIIFILFALI